MFSTHQRIFCVFLVHHLHSGEFWSSWHPRGARPEPPQLTPFSCSWRPSLKEQRWLRPGKHSQSWQQVCALQLASTGSNCITLLVARRRHLDPLACGEINPLPTPTQAPKQACARSKTALFFLGSRALLSTSFLKGSRKTSQPLSHRLARPLRRVEHLETCLCWSSGFRAQQGPETCLRTRDCPCHQSVVGQIHPKATRTKNKVFKFINCKFHPLAILPDTHPFVPFAHLSFHRITQIESGQHSLDH